MADPAAKIRVAQMKPVQLMRFILPLICALCMIASLPALAIAHDNVNVLVPSPDCIQTILDKDTAVGSDECLVALGSFPSRDGRRQDGHPYPIADLQTDRYSMNIHYAGGAFPDALLRNWPLSIDLNFWRQRLVFLSSCPCGDSRRQDCLGLCPAGRGPLL